MAGVDRRGFVLGAGAGLAAGLSSLPAALARAQAAPGDRASPSRAALLGLLETVRQLDETYLTAEEGVDAAWERAEGHAYLLHLVAAAHHLFLENDPERPRLERLETPWRRFLGGSPDALYLVAPLRGDRGYRVRGRSAGEVYRALTVYGGAGEGAWGERVIAHRNDREWASAPDGSFEIVLAAERPPDATGWLPLEPDARALLARYYFEPEGDATAARIAGPPLEITPLHDPAPRPPPDEAEVARRLRAMTDFVRDTTVMLFALPPGQQPSWVGREPNRFGRPRRWAQVADGGGWGEVDTVHSSARYRLAPDQALVVRGRLPDCAYAGVLLVNRWLQAFDWTRRRVSLNRRQIALEPDGTYRIVVAPEHPGHPNWLDTGGRPEGRIDWRFVLAAERPARPRAEVVPLASLRG